MPDPDPDPVPLPVPLPAPDAAAEPAAERGAEPGVVAEASTGTGAVAVAVAEAAPDAEAEAEIASEAVPVPAKPRRRGRTTLLIACAAVLGVLAGGGLGYRIQQQRTPTPLPPLTGPMLAQPKGAGPAAPVLPAAQDRDAIYGGDLLKLLTPEPKGAKEYEASWMTLAEYASYWTEPADKFEEFARDQFQRAVSAHWMGPHDLNYDVRILQFRDDTSMEASSLFTDQSGSIGIYDGEQGSDVDIPGTVHGYVWPSGRAESDDDYGPYYEGRALAEVGNLEIEVFVGSSHKVKISDVMPVITKQLERL